MSNKLIKELLINVKQKGLTTVVDSMDKLEKNLENAAAGAELLNSALQPIPESLQEIIVEAKQVDDVLSSLGKSKDTDKLEKQFEELDNTLTELIGSMASLQDSIVAGFNKSTSSASNDIKELLVALERLDDTTDGVARRTKILDNIYDKLGQSSTKAGKGLEGMNRHGRGQTRDFAAIAKLAGPLPLIYATIAANVFAVSEAFRILSDSAQLNRLEDIGIVMGQGIGVPIQSIARDLQEATGYTVSFEDALKQASSAATFGFTSKQITDMTIAARRASVALGVDMSDALNRITRGVSKLEVELLDELGITVRLEEAYSKYAATLGVSATALSGYQKQQAYLNAVLAESERRQSAVDPYLQANGWELLGAVVKSTTLEGIKWVAKVLDPVADFLAKIAKASPAEESIKSIREFSDLMKETQKNATDSSFLANSYVAFEEQVAGKLPKYVEEAKRTIADFDTFQKTIDFKGIALGLATLPAGYNDMAAEASAARQVLIEYNKTEQDTLQLIYEKTNATKGLTDAQKLAAAESVKNARVMNNESETLQKLATEAKGVQQPFEKISASLTLINQAQKLLAENAKGVDFFEQVSKLNPEGLSKSEQLMVSLAKEYALTVSLSTEQLKMQEKAYTLGLSSGELALKNLQLERQVLYAERDRLKVAEAHASIKLSNQKAIEASLLKEQEIHRKIQSEQVARIESLGELSVSQRRFTDGYSSFLSDYDIEKTINANRIENLQMQLANLSIVKERTKEIIDLELALNEAKRASADIDAREAKRKSDEAISTAQRNAGGAGGAGTLAGMDAAVNDQLKLAIKLYEERKISATEYEQLALQASNTAFEANQLRIKQESELNNLFMARTGQQSTLAMNAEEELAYQQQIGAQFYNNARDALGSFDPAMGAMFDGLQNFTTALTQVGKTSEGVWNGVSSGIQAAAGVMSFMSQKAISDIDRQIAAEKKKDGQSEASKKKIAQLEAKKAKENEKQQRAAIIANTAVGIMSAISTSGNIYAGLALAAVVAAMGAMQLSALDSSSIADPSAAAAAGKLELGSRQNNVDVSQSATGGELEYIRGSRGSGGIQDFVPRARGSRTSPNVSYITGEHGTEVVNSAVSKEVTSSEESKGTTSRGVTQFVLQVSALDSQSILDRAPELWAAVESEANSKGFTLARI